MPVERHRATTLVMEAGHIFYLMICVVAVSCHVFFLTPGSFALPEPMTRMVKSVG